MIKFHHLFIVFLVSFCSQSWAQPVPAQKNLIPTATPVIMPAPAVISKDLTIAPADKSKNNIYQGLSRRDPFKLPEYIVIKIRQKMAQNLVAPGFEDSSVDSIRRFPMGSYQLVGIIWDVKRPKAMFQDRYNTIHVLQVNDFIGNAKGVITGIQNGSVTIQEGKIPQIIKLKK